MKCWRVTSSEHFHYCLHCGFRNALMCFTVNVSPYRSHDKDVLLLSSLSLSFFSCFFQSCLRRAYSVASWRQVVLPRDDWQFWGPWQQVSGHDPQLWAEREGLLWNLLESVGAGRKGGQKGGRWATRELKFKCCHFVPATLRSCN